MGGAVAPQVLWEIAHDHGFKLPVKTYWEFKELVSARPGKVSSLDEYLAVLHRWTEKIQSSPQAMERSVYEVSFPLFDKVVTRAGPGQSPVYAICRSSRASCRAGTSPSTWWPGTAGS